VQSLLAASRQSVLIGMLGGRISWMQSLRVWLAGLFMSQVFITFIAGDVVRGVQFTKVGVLRRIAGRAVVFDRLIGLVALLFMVIATTPIVQGLSPDPVVRSGLIGLCLASVGGVAFFLASGLLGRIMVRLPGNLLRFRAVEILVDLLSVSRFIAKAPGSALSVFALSLVMHLLNIAALIAIARLIGIEAPIVLLACVSIPALLLTMLPISFGGWGVREAALVTGFGLLHIPAYQALAVSVGFGLSLILTSLPGVFAVWHRRTDPGLSASPQSA
jgi:uncharacterized membrane protein YbhN (UPF0104 family)